MKNILVTAFVVLLAKVSPAPGEGPVKLPTYPLLKLNADAQICKRHSSRARCTTPLAICPIGTSPVWVVDYNHNLSGEVTLQCTFISDNGYSGGEG